MANYAVELAGCIQQFVDDPTPAEQKVKALRKALRPDTWEAFGKLPWDQAEESAAGEQQSSASTENEGSGNEQQSTGEQSQ